MKSEFWNQRFSTEEFIYGIKPNEFFKHQINKLNPGNLLLPGEGEGRNALYAAQLGWNVEAFDFSETARRKALNLAEKFNVKIDYHITDLAGHQFKKNNYDAAAVIFLHMEQKFMRELFKKIFESLKPGGKILIEVFSKKQFGRSSGGPQILDVLYSMEEILDYTKDFKTESADEIEIYLNESRYHEGNASVIRYTGEKE